MQKCVLSSNSSLHVIQKNKHLFGLTFTSCSDHYLYDPFLHTKMFVIKKNKNWIFSYYSRVPCEIGSLWYQNVCSAISDSELHSMPNWRDFALNRKAIWKRISLFTLQEWKSTVVSLFFYRYTLKKKKKQSCGQILV